MILFFATHRAKGSQKDQDPFKAPAMDLSALLDAHQYTRMTS